MLQRNKRLPKLAEFLGDPPEAVKRRRKPRSKDGGRAAAIRWAKTFAAPEKTPEADA